MYHVIRGSFDSFLSCSTTTYEAQPPSRTLLLTQPRQASEFPSPCPLLVRPPTAAMRQSHRSWLWYRVTADYAEYVDSLGPYVGAIAFVRPELILAFIAFCPDMWFC